MSTSIRKATFAGMMVVILAGLLGVFAIQGVAYASNPPSLQSGVLASDPTDDTGNAPVHKDGWEKVGDAWNYWQDGVLVKGDWVDTATAPTGMTGVEEGVHRYWIDCNGNLAVNRLINPEKAKDDSPNAYLAYATKLGFVATGKIKIAGKSTTKVYLARATGDELGKLETGNKYGLLRTSAYDDGTERVYYIDPSKHCAIIKTNIKKATPVKIEGFGWVLPCFKGGYLLTGVKKKIGNRVYLAKANGMLESGNVKVGGKLTSIVKTGKYDGGTTRYYYIDPTTHSAVVKTTPVKAKNFGWVLPCNKGGYLATGRTVLGKKVYLARLNGKLETGNKLGLFTSRKYNAKHKLLRYYINPLTHAITYGKPVKAKGFGYVYAPNKGGYLLCGVTRVDSTHVVLADAEGRICMKQGWVWTSKCTGSRELYYLEPTAQNKRVPGARIGYFNVEGTNYFSYDEGFLLRNSYHLWDDDWYYAYDDGSLQWEEVVSHLYQEAQGYWSPSEYLIMVDIDDPKVLVLEGSQYNWDVKFIWDCCTGAPETPTCEGTFSVGIKGWSFGEGNGFSCYYYTQINGDYLFHTRLYYANTWDLMNEDNLGNRHSHGCVHLLDENAKWIWDNVPSGTTIGCIY